VTASACVGQHAMCAGADSSLEHAPAACMCICVHAYPQVEDPQTHQGRLLALVRSYLLPQGFPDSVAPQYASYMGWRGVQYFFGGAMSVFTTKCLLTSLGVAGRHSVSSTPSRRAPAAAGCPAQSVQPHMCPSRVPACCHQCVSCMSFQLLCVRTLCPACVCVCVFIPPQGEAAAAINWVLKDGAGRLGRFLFARWGRELDCELKQFRLAGDLLMEAGGPGEGECFAWTGRG
jgi:hypothetical protein